MEQAAEQMVERICQIVDLPAVGNAVQKAHLSSLAAA